MTILNKISNTEALSAFISKVIGVNKGEVDILSTNTFSKITAHDSTKPTLKNIALDLSKKFNKEPNEISIQSELLSELEYVESLALKSGHVGACKGWLHATLLGEFEYDEARLSFKSAQLSREISALFSSIAENFNYFTVENHRLYFSVEKYLQKNSNAITIIDKSIFITESLVKGDKDIFYITDKSDSGMKIMPYFIAPSMPQNVTFKFILDISDSMNIEDRLHKLKESVLKLSAALFEFQENATIQVDIFNHKCSSLGTYNKSNHNDLINAVNTIQAEGGTHLYKTVTHQISSIINSENYNNILLFTDGEDSNFFNHQKNIKIMREKIESIEENRTKYTNKFFILSYNVNQPEILEDIAKSFFSSVINTNEIDILNSLSDNNSLYNWATARELFTYSLTVDNKKEQYSVPVNLHGQIVALEPIEVDSHISDVSIVITGKNDTLIAEDHSEICIDSTSSNSDCPNVATESSSLYEAAMYPIEQLGSMLNKFAIWVTSDNQAYFPKQYQKTNYFQSTGNYDIKNQGDLNTLGSNIESASSSLPTPTATPQITHNK